MLPETLLLFSCYLSSPMSHSDTIKALPHYTGFLQCASPAVAFQMPIYSTLRTTWALLKYVLCNA